MIDADSLVRSKVDGAMAFPTITGPRNIWGCQDFGGFVSSFMVFEPSVALLARLVAFMSNPSYRSGVDQAWF